MIPTFRHLEKLTYQDIKEIAATNENMDLLLETLRDLKKLRMVRNFLSNTLKLNLKISPQVFHRLLDIPEVDIVESPNKTGELERVSIKETRQSEDPVTVANLNILLRELNRDLARFQERMIKEFPEPLLAQDMTTDRIELCQNWVDNLKKFHRKKFGYLFFGLQINRIEKAFRKNFPNSTHTDYLRTTWPKVEHELRLYRIAQTIEERWSPLCLDLFAILKIAKLTQALENLQEMGSLLWNTVYNGQQLKQSFKILDIRFNDTNTLFENKNLK